jgi:hypothetical protein
MAEAYPNSRFVGFDAFEVQLERARANAAAAGVGDRVSFEVLDASRGLPDRYDVVTTFDVVHDAVDPVGLLKSIRVANLLGQSMPCVSGHWVTTSTEASRSDERSSSTGAYPVNSHCFKPISAAYVIAEAHDAPPP